MPRRKQDEELDLRFDRVAKIAEVTCPKRDSKYDEIYKQIEGLEIGECVMVNVGDNPSKELLKRAMNNLYVSYRKNEQLKDYVEKFGKLKFRITAEKQIAVCLEEHTRPPKMVITRLKK